MSTETALWSFAAILRNQVYVNEFHVEEHLEFDNNDAKSRHILGFSECRRTTTTHAEICAHSCVSWALELA